MNDRPSSRNVDDVIITDGLTHRPSRAPDFETEAKALSTLASALAEDPGAVLQKLVDLIVETGIAGSAGISLLEGDNFRWDAIAGAWAHLRGEGMPFDASPCGVVVSRNAMLLFEHPEEVFPGNQIDPLIHETLLVPFHVDGKPVGTLWVLSHDEQRKFDSEDARLLLSLSRFASAAYQLNSAMAENESHLREEQAAARRLQRVSTELLAPDEPQALYDLILDAMSGIMRSQAASIQMLDDKTGQLKLIRSRGLHPKSVEFWQNVDANSASGCGEALRDCRRRVIFDVEKHPPFEGDAVIDEYRRSGLRAVQSTPLVARNGRRLGMISTLWAEPHEPSEDDFRSFDVLARQVADLIERSQSEELLRHADERLRQFGEASSDILWMRDAETMRWTYLTSAFEEIYGLSREEALTGDDFANWAELIVPEDRERALESIDRVRKGERAEFEYRVLRPSDGRIAWLRNTDFPIFDESGRVATIGGIGKDVTALKQAAQHQQTLLAELQHRVRNTLALVRSIARRTSDNSSSVEEMIAHFEGRLDAFSRVQAKLTRRADSRVDLTSLIEDEILAHAAREGGRVRIEGPEVALEPKLAERLSLAVHELATNAVKHGALGNGKGKVRIAWELQHQSNGGMLLFNWQESGVRLDEKPEREGFGMDLLRRSLPYDLGAETEVEFRPNGLHFQLRMPLNGAA